MTFDPLHKWLGIPASEQPPNHYRLLGIPLFEDDLEVIDAAADKQLAFLHDLTNGPHAEAAEDLSNRVSAARVCLCSQAKKANYDAKLRRKDSRVLAAASLGERQGTVSVARAPQPSRSAVQTPQNQDQTSGWMLIHRDGIEHGPYPFESLVDAAGRGRITPATMVRHPVITGDQWQQALSVKGIADACPASMAVASTLAETPAPVFSDSVVATALRPEPGRVSVKTRRKQKRSNRSWMATVIGSALPAVMLIALVVTIQRNPQLRLALVNLLSPGAEVGQENVEEPDGGEAGGSSGGGSDGVEIQIEPSDQDGGRGQNAPPPNSPGVGPLDDVERPPGPDFEPDPAPPKPTPVEKEHRLGLDLSELTWFAEIEGARRDDQFFVVDLDNVTTRLDMMEPLSGELSFDRPTRVIFSSLSSPNGFGMELTLIESKVDPAKISIMGRVFLDDKDFRLTNLNKERLKAEKSLKAAIDELNQALAARTRALAIKQRRGVDLDLDNWAEVTIQVMKERIPLLTQQRDLLQVQVVRLISMINWIEELNKKGELVICVRRFLDASDPEDRTKPSLGP